MKESKTFLYLASIFVISLSVFIGCDSNESKLSNGQTKDSSYQPVTITVDLLRSGKGDKVEETFESDPKRAVAFGDEFTDILLDLGLDNNMIGRTESTCKSLRTTFEERKKNVPVLGNKDLSQEKLLNAQPDFAIGWDSNFTEKKFSKDFCKDNGIAIYTPKCTGDHATIENLYTDYITLGQIFNVKSTAEAKVETMKSKVEKVKEKVKEVNGDSKRVFIYDSGEESPFTGCQGLPGDLIKIAGGKNIFDDIDKAWAHVSWEEVVNRNPEVIIIMNYNNEDVDKKKEFLYSNAALKDVDAIKNKRVYPILLGDVEGSAGTADGVEDLAKAFYPDVFDN